MEKLLIFLALAAFVDCSQINFRLFNDYMYQTSVSVGKSSKKFNLLLDFTSTQLWFFATNNNSTTTPFLQLSSLNKTNISNQSTIMAYMSNNGLYDYDFAVRAYQTGNYPLTFDGNAKVNSSTFGIVYADNYSMPSEKESVLGVGIIGIGSLLSSNVTNYLTGLMNSTSQFVLCTRPVSSQVSLIINEPYFNKTILAKAVATNYSKTPKNPGAFEFNITSVKIGIGYYVERKIRAVISTMTNFLTVDKGTWRYISRFFRPAYDKKSDDYLIRCKQLRQMRIDFSVQSANSTANNWLFLPAVDLVQVTKRGYCILKIRPSEDDFWTLGGPFLRHFSLKVELGKQQLTFVNNTLFNPKKQSKF